jgi:DNA-binding response OmpR family regulator
MNYSLETSGEEGLELLQKIKILQPELPVILLTGWGSIELAVCGLLIGVTYIVRLICAAMVCGVLTGVLENVGVIKGRQGVCIRDNVLIKQGRHTIHRFHYTYALCLGAAIMVVLNIKA